jgi:hypothetical protein
MAVEADHVGGPSIGKIKLIVEGTRKQIARVLSVSKSRGGVGFAYKPESRSID